MNKKLKRKQALIMAEPYRTPFNSKVAKVSGDVIEDSVGGINKPTRSYDFKVNGFSNVFKSSNLLNLTDKADTTTNGITYSIKNGIITLNGTNSSTSIQWIWIDFVSTLNGTYSFNSFALTTTYVTGTRVSLYDNTTEKPIAQLFNNEYSSTIELTNYECKKIGIACGEGQTFTNATIKPILVSGSTIPSTFEPYIDPYIESFADKKNLIKFGDVEKTTQDGITYSVKNGVFNIDGTNSKAFFMRFNIKNSIHNTPDYTFKVWWDDTTTKPGTPYSVEWNLTGYRNDEPTSYYAQIKYTNSNYLDGSNVITNTNDIGYITNMTIYIPSGTTFKNQKFKPMLVEGNKIPTTFLPYQDKYSAFLNVKGKNLFDKSQIREGYYGGVVNTDAGNYDSNYQTISPNKTYYISGTIGNFHVLSVYDKQKNKISTLISNTTARTFTTPSNAYYYIYSSNTTNGGNVPDTIMISEGDTDPTEFEPYYSFTKEVLIKQPLRKFDYLTYDGVYRQTNEIVLDGTNNIYVDDTGTIIVMNIDKVNSLNTDWGINYASQLMVTTSNLPLVPCRDIQVEKQKGIGTNNGDIYLKLDDSADNSLNNWTVEKVNNYFKQNPITITYKTVDQTFEATSLTRLLFKNGYNKITAFDSINNNAIVEYLEYYKSK